MTKGFELLPDEIVWMMINYLTWDDIRCLNIALVDFDDEETKLTLCQFVSFVPVMGGILYKTHFMSPSNVSSVQFYSLQVSLKRNNRENLVDEELIKLNSCAQFKSLSFHCQSIEDSKSDVEIIIGALTPVTLQGLQIVIVVKHFGLLSESILKRVINNSKSLIRLELFCGGVTCSVIDSLSVQLLSNLIILRLELCVDLRISSLCALIRKFKPQMIHFHLFCYWEYDSSYGLGFEYISSSCNRKDITSPTSARSQENHLPGNTLILLGGHSLNAILVNLIVRERMPWWIENLTTLIWQITAGVPPGMFQHILKGNKMLQSLDLSQSRMSLKSMCIGLQFCSSLYWLTLIDVQLVGRDLVDLVRSIPTLQVVRFISHIHITCHEIHAMFALHKKVNLVLTGNCVNVSEDVFPSVVGLKVSTHGEWTKVERK